MTILYIKMNIAQVLRFDHSYDENQWPEVACHFEKIHLPWIAHAAECKIASCQKENCIKFRCMNDHFQSCREKKSCDYCQVAVDLYKWHSIKCQNFHCQVPLCQQLNEVYCVDSLMQLGTKMFIPKQKRSPRTKSILEPLNCNRIV